MPNPATSHNLILFQFMPLAPHTLSLTPQPHISSLQSHSLYLSSLTHCLTRPQAHKQSSTGSRRHAVKHRQSSSPISHYCHRVTSLQLSTLSTPFRPHHRRSHTVAQPSAPLIFLAHGLTASLHLDLHFFLFFFLFFFSGFNLSQYEFVFVILKGKIIDLKFVFGL